MNFRYIWAKIIKRLGGKAIRGCNIDKTSAIYPGCNIINSKIGKYTYCGYYSLIIKAEIGSFCSISNNVIIGGPSHSVEMVSTSPIFNKRKKSIE